MNNPIVSIIIPIYNAEKYLNKCLDSLLVQTLLEFEIICVDDGSTDRSLCILNEFAERDDRIIIMHQKNMYAGIARNNGLKIARGKYILFLDADDLFSNNLLFNTVNKAEKTDSEIVIYNGYIYRDDKNDIKETPWLIKENCIPEKDVFSAEECSDFLFNLTTPAPWNKLYRHEFIKKNHLLFQNIKRANDLYFTYTAFINARKISILKDKLIYYRISNPNSLQGTSDETVFDSYNALLKLKLYMILNKSYEKYEKSFGNLCLSNCIYTLNAISNEKLQKKYFNRLKNDIFENLGIIDRNEEYFYFGRFKDYYNIMNYTFEEYRKININLIKNLITILPLYDYVIIYGAGFLAGEIINNIIERGMNDKIIAVAVTCKKGNPEFYKGYKVFEISDVVSPTHKTLVIVAVSSEYHNQIIRNLKQLGYNDIIPYTR